MKGAVKVRNSLIKAWYGVLFVLMAIGGYAIIQKAQAGMAITNLTNATPWGAWVAFYIFFVGLSAGSFLLSTMVFVFKMEQYERIGRDALLVAILSIMLAGLFIILDLGKMERFINIFRYWNFTSILAWEVRFYIIYVSILLAELYFSMRQDLIRMAEGEGWKASFAKLLALGSTDLSEESKQRDHKMLKILGAIGIPIAIFGVHGGTEILSAVAKTRSFWYSDLFPATLTSLVSGTALLMALYVIRTKVIGRQVDIKMVQSLAGLLAVFLLLNVGLEFYELFIGAYSLKHEELAIIKTIIGSDFSWSFWGVQIFIGVIVPLFILFSSKLRQSVTAVTLAAILAVIGILGVRFNIVIPALIVPILQGLPWGYYVPTLTEWMSSIGIIAFGLSVYTFAIKVLPIDSLEELEGGSYDG
ncbi:MAG: polysulfide reductase NrfD [Firmicutes bacterium]|nr:polysulfide reductase NrfD [Bacillota bacterium]